MARDVIYKCQYVTGASDTQVTRLRSAPAELSTFLKKNPGQGLDRYWHAVPYLIAGRATGLKEPLRWFTGGGEVLGRNDAGPIRYLSPDRVARLAEAVAEEPPDELGHTNTTRRRWTTRACIPDAGSGTGRTTTSSGPFESCTAMSGTSSWPANATGRG